MLRGSAETVKRARRLRREMLFPEVLLWIELRKRLAGLKFRRQQPASRMVTDFFCHSAKLIVEVDGRAHDSSEAAARDERRDAWFRRFGFRVLRLPAPIVLNERNAAVSAIIHAAGARAT